MRDFGPLHDFWTFLFKCLNKVLKSFKTNNHDHGELETTFFQDFQWTCEIGRLVSTLTLSMSLSYPQIRPSPAPTSDYLGPSRISRTTRFTLGLLISAPSRTTRTTSDPRHWSHLGSLGTFGYSD